MFISTKEKVVKTKIYIKDSYTIGVRVKLTIFIWAF